MWRWTVEHARRLVSSVREVGVELEAGLAMPPELTREELGFAKDGMQHRRQRALDRDQRWLDERLRRLRAGLPSVPMQRSEEDYE